MTESHDMSQEAAFFGVIVGRVTSMPPENRHCLFAIASNVQDTAHTRGQPQFGPITGDSFSPAQSDASSRPAFLGEAAETGVVAAALNFHGPSRAVSVHTLLQEVLRLHVGGEEAGDDLSEHFVDVDVEFGAGFGVATAELAGQPRSIFRRHLASGREVRLVSN